MSSFLKDKNNKPSSSRLCMLLGVAVGSAVVLVMAINGTLTDGIFFSYIGATGGVYVGGKIGDRT